MIFDIFFIFKISFNIVFLEEKVYIYLLLKFY